MPLTALSFRLDYTPENLADFVPAFYEPVLAQAGIRRCLRWRTGQIT